MSARRHAGFTLIELLVVIAIIAILAGMLFPVFARARGKAEQADCISNSKQIVTALLLYSDDFDTRLPVHRFDPGGANEYYWVWALYPYTKSTEICTCKAFPNDQVYNGGRTPLGDTSGVSYGINMLVTQGRYRKLTRIATPAQTVLLYDLDEGPYVSATNVEGGAEMVPWSGLIDDPARIASVREGVRANHAGDLATGDRSVNADTGFATVAYCDGHVKAVKETYLLDTSPNLWDPGR